MEDIEFCMEESNNVEELKGSCEEEDGNKMRRGEGEEEEERRMLQPFSLVPTKKRSCPSVIFAAKALIALSHNNPKFNFNTHQLGNHLSLLSSSHSLSATHKKSRSSENFKKRGWSDYLEDDDEIMREKKRKKKLMREKNKKDVVLVQSPPQLPATHQKSRSSENFKKRGWSEDLEDDDGEIIREKKRKKKDVVLVQSPPQLPQELKSCYIHSHVRADGALPKISTGMSSGLSTPKIRIKISSGSFAAGKQDCCNSMMMQSAERIKKQGPDNLEQEEEAEIRKKMKKHVKVPALEPILGLPEDLRTYFDALGAQPVLVIQKVLTKTDLSTTHNRLSMPSSKINGDFVEKFLTEDEKTKLQNNIHIGVSLIDPRMHEYTSMNFTRWSMSGTSMYVLVTGWNNVWRDNRLKEGMTVQIWSFRLASNTINFALTVRRDSEEQ